MTLSCWLIITLVVIKKAAITNSDQPVIVQPMSVVQAEGLEAVFECLYPGAVAYGWVLNGVLQAFYPSDVRTYSPSADSRIARLIIPATQKYNNTVVQCQSFGPHSEAWVSENATLSILMNGIREISLNNNHTVSWSGLVHSLTTYFVDIKQVGSTEIILSELVNDTEYFIPPIGSNVCDIFTVTVTPTDGRNNATHSTSVTGYFPNRKDNMSIACYKTDVTEQRECHIRFESPLMECTCVLDFVGADSPELLPIRYTTAINGTGDYEYIEQVNILPNRKYRINVTIDVNGHIETLPQQSITTHDIVDASVSQSSIPGALNTSCLFINNTTARGYLAVVTNITCQANFFVVYNIRGTNDTLEKAGKGNSSVSFFDLKSDGLPIKSEVENGFIGAASMRNTTISSDQHQYVETNFPLRDAYWEMPTQNEICFGVYTLSKKYLVLLSKCLYSDLLMSLVVSNLTETCIDLEDGHYTAAFFRVNNSEYNTIILDKSPEQHISIIVNNSMTSSSGTSTTNMIFKDIETTLNGANVAIIVTVCCVLLLSFLGTTIGTAVCLLKKNALRKELRINRTDHESPFRELQSIEKNTLETEDALEPPNAFVESKGTIVENDKNLQIGITQSPCVKTSDLKNDTQIYAHTEVELSQVMSLNTHDVHEVEYALLDHGKLVEIPSEELKSEKQDSLETPQLPTALSADTLHALLTPAADKWNEIGLAMGIDEDTLEDEIYAGNSTDWLRLGEVCGMFCNKTERLSWEEVVHILWKVEEWEIADKICRQEKLQVEPPVETMKSPPTLPPKSVIKTEKLS